MLVDGVRLRLEGRRLARQHVRDCLPVRGRYLATLVAPGSIIDPLIPQLEHVEITRLSGRGFILSGIEDCGSRKFLRAFRQSWWCRVVTDVPAAVLRAAR